MCMQAHLLRRCGARGGGGRNPFRAHSAAAAVASTAAHQIRRRGTLGWPAVAAKHGGGHSHLFALRLLEGSPSRCGRGGNPRAAAAGAGEGFGRDGVVYTRWLLASWGEEARRPPRAHVPEAAACGTLRPPVEVEAARSRAPAQRSLRRP